MTKKLFALDMDGVVSDWHSGIEQIIGYKSKNPHEHFPPHDWEIIKQAHRLFLTLPLMPHAYTTVNTARKFRDNLNYELVFLTALPVYNDMPWAAWDKILWAQHHFPDIPVHFGPYAEDKQRRSAPGNILVDDKPSNCIQWESHGGTAIPVIINEEHTAIQTMEELYEKKLHTFQ